MTDLKDSIKTELDRDCVQHQGRYDPKTGTNLPECYYFQSGQSIIKGKHYWALSCTGCRQNDALAARIADIVERVKA